MADGASFQIDVGVNAAGVDSAASSVDALSKRLTDAGVASVSAANALAAGEASYNTAQANADRTAKSLERIGIAADAQKGKLQKALDAGDTSGAERASARLETLMQRQSEAATKAEAAKSALTEEASALDKLKTAADAAKAAEEQIEKAQEDATTAADNAAKSQTSAANEGDGSARKLAAGFGRLGGPLGAIGQKVFGLKEGYDKLQSALGDSGPEVVAAVGVAAVAAAAVALTAALVVGIAKIAQWAVGLADAARSNELLSEGIAKSVAGGQALNKKLDDLSTQVPLTREELSSMASQLANSGLKGEQLSATLEKNAVAAAKLKFGPEWSKQMNSLTEQSKRLQIGVSSIFGGLKIDKLLEQLSSLVDLFNANDAAGQGIKVLFESLFQPLIDGVTGFIPKARAAFLQFEILVLKAAIAIKPWTSKIELVAEVFGVLALVIGGVVVGAFLMMSAIAAVAVGAVIAAILLVQKAVGTIQAGFAAFKDFLSSFSLADVGAQIIAGLANGITNAGGQVLSAMKNVVGGAVDAAKKALGIASPSKVFAEIGMNTGAGMAKGVDSSTDGVQSALETMVAPPQNALAAVGAPKPGGDSKAAPAPAAASSLSSSSANLQGAVFNFYGVKDADDAEARFGELLTKLLEGDVSQLGSAVPS